MPKEHQLALTGSERALVEQVAHERGVSFEEAANQLFAEGLARRVKKKTRRRPCNNVRKFRNKGDE